MGRVQVTRGGAGPLLEGADHTWLQRPVQRLPVSAARTLCPLT
jgi:hypothetical protein